MDTLQSKSVFYRVKQRFKVRTVLTVALLCISCGGGGSGSSSSSGSAGGGAAGGSTGSGGTGSGSGSPMQANATDVLTYHNDLARTGQMLAEAVLTPANVTSATFGKVAFLAADGKVDAQPLYVGLLPIGAASHNVVLVATEHATVYAYDSDTGAVLWQRSLLAANETPSDTRNCAQITPEIGITATPVIDRSRGAHGTLYAVAMSKDANGGYHQRLHALDLANGSELSGSPAEIAGTYPGSGSNSSNGVTVFDPKQYAARAALTLVNGNVYVAWTSHCDIAPYGGWIMAYDAGTLAQTSVLNITPDGSGGAVWMSGAGIASDGASLYLLDANGTFDTALNAQGFPVNGNFGNAFLKLATSPRLAVADYFAVFDTVTASSNDEDLGSGGALVLPDQTAADGSVKHLAVGAGKDAKIYVVDRDAMGKFNPNANNIWQEIDGQLAGSVFSMPAYFNHTVYYGASGDMLKAFPLANARLAGTPASHSATTFPFPGATPSVSANGTSNAIVWAAENGTAAVLHAYDANDLSRELYNSNQAGTRDQFGAGNKFIAPMIANARVYVGTTNGVAVFGLLK